MVCDVIRLFNKISSYDVQELSKSNFRQPLEKQDCLRRVNAPKRFINPNY